MLYGIHCTLYKKNDTNSTEPGFYCFLITRVINHVSHDHSFDNQHFIRNKISIGSKVLNYNEAI